MPCTKRPVGEMGPIPEGMDGPKLRDFVRAFCKDPSLNRCTPKVFAELVGRLQQQNNPVFNHYQSFISTVFCIQENEINWDITAAILNKYKVGDKTSVVWKLQVTQFLAEFDRVMKKYLEDALAAGHTKKVCRASEILVSVLDQSYQQLDVSIRTVNHLVGGRLQTFVDQGPLPAAPEKKQADPGPKKAVRVKKADANNVDPTKPDLDKAKFFYSEHHGVFWVVQRTEEEAPEGCVAVSYPAGGPGAGLDCSVRLRPFSWKANFWQAAYLSMGEDPYARECWNDTVLFARAVCPQYSLSSVETKHMKKCLALDDALRGGVVAQKEKRGRRNRDEESDEDE